MAEAYFSNKNLLVLATSFPDESNHSIKGIFVKDQLNVVKNDFNKVFVIAPIHLLKKRASISFYKDYQYDNVSVYYPKSLYIPLDYLNGFALDSRRKAVAKQVAKIAEPIDLIHAHFTYPAGYIASYLKKSLQVPTILTIHENNFWLDAEIASNHKRYQIAWKSANRLLRVNFADKKKLLRYNKNTYHINNCVSNRFVPMDKQKVRKLLHLSETGTIIFSYGNHVKRKGFQDLIRAMAILLHSDEKDLVCYIGGSGPLSSDLQQLINELGLANQVKLLGKLGNSELVYWLNAADLFVMPSHNESFGITQFEAFTCKTPVVTTYNGSSEYLIPNEDIALLAEPENPPSLAKAIASALTKEWNLEAIASFAQQFSERAFRKKILAHYQAVIGL